MHLIDAGISQLNLLINIKINNPMELFIKILSEQEEEQHWCPCECFKCGWIGSSKQLDGGGPIADTGDYDDTYCPVCGSVDPDETDNEQPLQSLVEKLNKAHALLKQYREKAEGCDCSKHIYSHYEEENRRLIKELEELKSKQ